MEVIKMGTPESGEVSYSAPTDAALLRELVNQVGLSIRGAADELDVSERQMRYYAAGKQAVPRVVLFALRYLIQQKKTTGRVGGVGVGGAGVSGRGVGGSGVSR